MMRQAGAPIPDDGIPILTDVVDAAVLAPVAPSGSGPQDGGQGAADAAPSLAMFPELEPGARAEPGPWTAAFDAEEASTAHATPGHAAPEDGAAGLPAFAAGFAADTAAPFPLPDAELDHGPPVPAAPSGAPWPGAVAPWPGAGAPWPGESRTEMETRIFESLAARLDRLLDERLAPIIEGSVEAAFAGVKAALSASLNEAMREAVEQAVRNEFDRRTESGPPP